MIRAGVIRVKPAIDIAIAQDRLLFLAIVGEDGFRHGETLKDEDGVYLFGQEDIISSR
jgi:hypothetical protein